MHAIDNWTHLWHGANSVLASAPTISQHLGHRLINEGYYDMTWDGKSMLCAKCGALMWTASVRIRAPRRPTGAHNRVTRRCPSCNTCTSEKGSTKRLKVEKKLTSLEVTTLERVTVSPSSASSLAVKNGDFKVNASLSAGAISKKKSYTNPNCPSSAHDGSNPFVDILARSFLFENTSNTLTSEKERMKQPNAEDKLTSREVTVSKGAMVSPSSASDPVVRKGAFKLKASRSAGAISKNKSYTHRKLNSAHHPRNPRPNKLAGSFLFDDIDI